MAEAINTDQGATVVDHASHTVAVRQSWSENWTSKPYLYCDEFTLTAAPALDQAKFTYDYGRVLRHDKNTYEDPTPPKLNIGSYFVRVSIEMPNDEDDEPVDPILWYGIIVEEWDQQDGTVSEQAQGKQTFVAVGLAYLLDRKPITTSVVAPATDGDANVTIKRAINFNLGGGHFEHAVGVDGSNRLADEDPIFDGPVSKAIYWRVDDMIRYLVEHHSPSDQFGIELIPFEIDPDSQFDALHMLQPEVRLPTNPTFLGILNALIDRRRITGWKLIVDNSDEDAPEKVLLSIFTFNETDLEIEGGTLSANPNQVTLDYGSQVDVKRAIVNTSQANVYDQILVRGTRRGCCFSVSFAEPEYGIGSARLVPDWRPEDQTSYNTGSPSAPAEQNFETKQTLHRRWRLQHPLKRVYSYFRLNANWDGKDRDEDVVCPESTAEDPLTADSEKFWVPGLRFEHHLPFLIDRDYSGDKIGAGTVVETTPTDGQPEYLRPMVFILISGTVGDEEDPPKYQHAEHQAAHNAVEVGEEVLHFSGWSTGIRAQDNAPGLEIKVNGAMQHVIAKNSFEDADDADHNDYQPIYDFHDFLATVFLHADCYAEVLHPLTVETANTDRTLVIDVGERCRLDYVAPGTIVAINDGELVTSDGGYLRDDRETLKILAQVAYRWYSTPRKALEVTYHQLTNAFSVGDLITEIGSGPTLQTVNTVITSIAYDLIAGTTTIRTQFADLDVAQL